MLPPDRNEGVSSEQSIFPEENDWFYYSSRATIFMARATKEAFDEGAYGTAIIGGVATGVFGTFYGLMDVMSVPGRAVSRGIHALDQWGKRRRLFPPPDFSDATPDDFKE